MKEISLHILDIVENSFRADAKNVRLLINENLKNNIISIIIEDDGNGMSSEFLENVTNPFKTTRTTRNVGLGLSLINATVKRCNGEFEISSEIGVGTIISMSFQRDHIDLPPLGDLTGTIVALAGNSYGCNIIFDRKLNGENYELDTLEIKNILECEDLTSVDILSWMREFIREKEKGLIIQD